MACICEQNYLSWLVMVMGEIKLDGPHNKERLCDSLWASCGRTQAIMFTKCFLVWTCWVVDTKIFILLDTRAFRWLGPQAHKQTQSTDLARERERETATVAEKLAGTQTAEWHITTHQTKWHITTHQTKWYITTHCVCHILPHTNQTHCALHT